MRLLVVVQARTGSTRLPGKVLLPLAGRPLLARVVERVRCAQMPLELTVATTTESSDDPVVELCRGIDVRCHRGHPTDLLDRHYRAGLEAGADAVAKIPSDCPLIDPAAIDRVLGFFLAHPGRYDYVGNLRPPTWPDGNDVEVMPMEALATAWREAESPLEREHTTPFLWDRPERFRCANVAWETGLDYSATHRWTIDYPEDYDFIRTVYDELHAEGERPFSAADVLDLLRRRPEIAALNARYAGTTWITKNKGRLRTA